MARLRHALPPGLAITALMVLTDTGLTDEDPLLQQSRETTALFAAEMQSALQEAMASGGPVAAIDVCKETAPDIAARLSDRSGATVSRTSLKVRNPANRALDWQVAILEQFEQAGTASEHFERMQDGSARYLKAIPTGAICLNCHGTVLPPDIRSKLDAAYPGDEARGYYLGDIRGAFSVVWPADD